MCWNESNGSGQILYLHITKFLFSLHNPRRKGDTWQCLFIVTGSHYFDTLLKDLCFLHVFTPQIPPNIWNLKMFIHSITCFGEFANKLENLWGTKKSNLIRKQTSLSSFQSTEDNEIHNYRIPTLRNQEINKGL